MPKKRIWNPLTKSWYTIRQRSTVKGGKGTISGIEKPQKRKKRK